jgi:endonuclease III
MNKGIIKNIFSAFAKKNPNPKTELNFTNNYTMLVAVVLSAQATDTGVNKATKALFDQISKPEEMIALGEEELKKHVRTIGLFNSKAKNIIKLSHVLVESYNSQIPNSLEELIKLPGVGTKTAKVVLNAAFNINEIAVDTHVFRTSRRLGIATKKTIPSVEKELPKQIPKEYQLKAHHWLVLHGRYICKARKPLCEECFLKEYCKFFKSQKN